MSITTNIKTRRLIDAELTNSPDPSVPPTRVRIADAARDLVYLAGLAGVVAGIALSPFPWATAAAWIVGGAMASYVAYMSAPVPPPPPSTLVEASTPVESELPMDPIIQARRKAG